MRAARQPSRGTAFSICQQELELFLGALGSQMTTLPHATSIPTRKAPTSLDWAIDDFLSLESTTSGKVRHHTESPYQQAHPLQQHGRRAGMAMMQLADCSLVVPARSL